MERSDIVMRLGLSIITSFEEFELLICKKCNIEKAQTKNLGLFVLAEWWNW